MVIGLKVNKLLQVKGKKDKIGPEVSGILWLRGLETSGN